MSQNLENLQSSDIVPGIWFGEHKNYKIIKKLGEGGMGQAWLAEKEETLANAKKSTSKFVLKLLPSTQNDEKIAKERFSREYELIRHLRHRNICLAIETGQDENSRQFYIITDHVEGVTLREWLKTHKGQVTAQLLKEIFKQLASALDYLHSKKVMHRDIKSSNIMMTGNPLNPSPVLIDFGLADRIPEDIRKWNTVTNANLQRGGGTEPYTSPEQRTGRAQDGRTDQYALAMLLYEVINGDFPQDVFHANAEQIPKVLINGRTKHFTKQQKKAIKKAVDSSQLDRFSSCTEFVEEAFDTASAWSRFCQFAATFGGGLGGTISFAKHLLPKDAFNIQAFLRNPLQNELYLLVLGGAAVLSLLIWFLFGRIAKWWRARGRNRTPLQTKAEPDAHLKAEQTHETKETVPMNPFEGIFKAEEKKRTEEKRLAEERRLAKEKKRAEQKRREEERRLAEEKKREEQKRRAEEKKREEQKRREEQELSKKKKRLENSIRRAYDSADFPLAKKYIDEFLSLDPENPHYLQFRDFIQMQITALSQSRKAGEQLVKTVDGIKYAFRWCPAGMFVMGSPEDEPGRKDEEVQHEVTLTRGFWMLETQVTQKMWESVMGGNPSYFKGDQNPVECVSWNDCQDFCRELSAKLGGTVSLPTEAQWEYACRAGTTGTYAGQLNAMGWYSFNSGKKMRPVRQKMPNAWQLYDMHGNVREWSLDWYGENYYAESPACDPIGPQSGSGRVSRGGSWNDDASDCRSANRSGVAQDDRYGDLGFRIVLEDSEKQSGAQ